MSRVHRSGAARAARALSWAAFPAWMVPSLLLAGLLSYAGWLEAGGW